MKAAKKRWTLYKGKADGMAKHITDWLPMLQVVAAGKNLYVKLEIVEMDLTEFGHPLGRKKK